MPMIRSESIDGLREIIDLVEVAGRYVDLKKDGPASFKGLSPFNHEKTPSFKVNTQKGIWHDFSSGNGGDAISLLMKLDNMTFVEAVEALAEQYGYTLEYEDGPSSAPLSSAPLEMYKDWCIENLLRNGDQLKYLLDRGVTMETIREFEIGFSPSSREVVDFVRNSVMTENDAISLGIIDVGDRGLYARFIDRIIFPIRNHNGKLCGFSGRTTTNHPAKYVNTKDTPLFKKHKLMYGFDKAKEEISKNNFFVLSEGQMDVVMEHQAGIKYAFASMGTALTQDHINIIKRFADKGIVAYDGDKAGVEAAFKAASLFIRNAVDVKVVIFENDEDPADLIAEERGSELVERMKKGIPAIQFCIDRILVKFDTSNPYDKAKAFSEIESFTKGMIPVIQQAVIEEASKRLGTVKVPHVSQPERRYGVGDTRERALIKTAVLSGNQEVMDEIVRTIKCFHLKEAVEAIRDRNFSHESITEIVLDDEIVMSANIHEDIRLFKIWCLKKFMSSIKASNRISPRDKIIKTREIQAKIEAIEKEAT